MIAALLAAALALGAADLDALQKKLRSSDQADRRAAVQELAALKSKEAWSLVIGALKDPAPMVADEAEIQVAAIDVPAVLGELLGRSGLNASDPWVQVRAAGALGSIAIPVEASALTGTLSDKDAEVRRTLCASIESLARNGKLVLDKSGRLVAALDKLRRKDDDAAVRAAATLAREHVGDDPKGEVLIEASKDASAEVHCALAAILAARGGPDVAIALAGPARHPSVAVRAQVVRSLAELKNGAAAGLLVEMLEREKNRRLAWTIGDLLEAWSGIRGGRDAAIWRGWYEKLGADWKPSTGKSAAPRGDTGTAVLYGMPLLSDNLVILVDLSGSMWQEREGGVTRKQAVDAELRRTLESLPPESRFNLIPYTGAPIPWEKSLVPATPSNVKRALAFFEGCKATGQGNFWDAAMLALEDPGVDTLLVLFDGAPTGGRRWNIDLMADRFAERNRFRHVVLDALIFDAKRGIETRWRKFAEATGGRVQPIDL